MRIDWYALASLLQLLVIKSLERRDVLFGDVRQLVASRARSIAQWYLQFPREHRQLLDIEYISGRYSIPISQGT